MGFPKHRPDASVPSSMTVAVRAADLLEEACRRSLDGTESLHVEVVRDLVLDLKRQFDALAGLVEKDGPAEPSAERLVDAALACADLATLAACNLAPLPPEEARRAADAARLAAGAAHSLVGAVGEENPEMSPDSEEEYLRRDARGALWRADLASRQVDELRASGGAG